MNRYIQNFIQNIKADKFDAEDLEVLYETIQAYLSDKRASTQYKTLEDFENAADVFMTEEYDDAELQQFFVALSNCCSSDFPSKNKLLNETRQEMSFMQDYDEEDLDQDEYDTLEERNDVAYANAMKQLKVYWIAAHKN